MVKFTIVFNNYRKGFFYAGEEVSGSVTLYNEKPRKFRALLLKVTGAAEVSWSESTGTGDNKQTETIHDREEYLRTVTFLLNNGAMEQELAAGSHTFTFCFVLPVSIPSTFYNFYGNVKYVVRVEMDRYLKFNHSHDFPFNVISSLDLNYESAELRQPLRGEITKKFFLGLSSKPLTIVAEVPYRGFVAGQTLSISVKVINDSRQTVGQVYVELRRLCRFSVSHSISTRHDRQSLVKGSNSEGVEVKSKSDLTFSLLIPAVEPTDEKFCKLIKKTYEIAIIAKVGGFHRSPECALPITIGTYPLHGKEIHIQSASNSEPPSYEFAMKLDHEDVKLEKSNKF